MFDIRKRIANLARSSLSVVGVTSVSKTLLGERIRVPIEMGALRPLLLDHSYTAYCPEPEVLRTFLGLIRSTDLVYDVGAFVGIDSVLFSRVGGAVVAIEPNPSTFEVLQETVRANRATNIVAVSVAAGSSDGEAGFEMQSSSSRLRLDQPAGNRTTVKVESLDTLATARGATPDAIKIDVEGAELEVLRGADKCLSKCRVLCIEVHLTKLPLSDGSPEGIWTLLKNYGYGEICRYPGICQGQPDETRVHVIFERPTSSPWPAQ